MPDEGLLKKEDSWAVTEQVKGWDGRCPHCGTRVIPEAFKGVPVKKFAYRCGKCGWEMRMTMPGDSLMLVT